MKKIFYCLMAATAAFAGSCTNEENVNAPQSDGTVSFQISLPVNLGTRAYGDGLTATTLHYYVYEKSKGDAAAPVFQGEAQFTDKNASFSVKLIASKTYSIAFWADAGTPSPYTYNPTERTISVNYENATAQDEKRDAFYYYLPDVTVATVPTDPIKLTRPFAQINVGTSDFDDAVKSGWTISQSGLKVTGAGTKFNLTTGAVTAASDTDITFANAAIPTEKFPDDIETSPYKYLSMNYILIGTKTTVDVKLTVTDGTTPKELSYTSIPVKKNYRTNIFGALLTNSTTFNVTIDPSFDGAENSSQGNTGN